MQTLFSRPALNTVSALAIALCSLVSLAAPVAGQEQDLSKLRDSLKSGGVFTFGGDADLEAEGDPQISVRLTRQGNTNVVKMSVLLDLPDGAYTYPQQASFGIGTSIELTELTGLVATDDGFVANQKPKTGFDKVLDQTVSKFTKDVTWTRQLMLSPDTDIEDVRVQGRIKFQVCKLTCRLFDKTFDVMLGGDSAADEISLANGYQVTPTHKTRGRQVADPATLRFDLTPADVKSGDTVTLAVTIAPKAEWHTFAIDGHSTQVSAPTVIDISQMEGLEPIDAAFVATRSPEIENPLDNITEYVYHDPITWTRKYKVTNAESYGVRGAVQYQLCKTSCIQRQQRFALGSQQQPDDVALAMPVSGPLDLTSQTMEHASDVALTRGGTSEDTDSANTRDSDSWTFADIEKSQEGSLLIYLASAFLGGLILNVMPCVLPVLAIKALSFVHQAGERRHRILMLNVSYAAGVMVIFMALACLAFFAGFSREIFFQSDVFGLVMASVVFAMGLSMLGVFEIPVPGMVGSAAGAEQREGLTGAFLTGIFATILAVPCSGPLMGATLAWTAAKPAYVVFSIWGTMGLGMATPYLMLGMFPALIDRLPKPGMWMVRLKEFAGFALLATVIWLLSWLSDELILPTLIILLGIGLGVWMIGTLHDHSSTPRHKNVVRLSALMLAGGVMAFGVSMIQEEMMIAESERMEEEAEPDTEQVVQHREGELPWQKFSTERLEDLVLKQNKTVLIDFTADWCAICITNEKVALNTEKTLEFVQKHDIVPLHADFTKPDAEIRQWLDRFRTDTVPLTVIFPAGQPTSPIVLRSVYSQGQLLEGLETAVAKAQQTATLPRQDETATR